MSGTALISGEEVRASTKVRFGENLTACMGRVPDVDYLFSCTQSNRVGGVPVAAIREYMDGKAFPDIETLIVLADSLRVSVKDLVNGLGLYNEDKASIQARKERVAFLGRMEKACKKEIKADIGFDR